MPIELKMPALSPTMEEGTLAKWLVKEGDVVKSGDLLAEIETDKATMEFEAVDEGTISQLVVPAGTEGVKVGAVIALIAGEDEDAAPAKKPAEAAPDAKADAPKADAPKADAAKADAKDADKEAGSAGSPAASLETRNAEQKDEAAAKGSESAPAAPAPAAPAGEGRVKASPLARRLAEQQGLDLASVAGSGPNGRVVKADLANAKPGGAKPAEATSAPAKAEAAPAAAKPAPAASAASPIPHEVSKLSGMRKTIARRLTESKQQVPHIYLTVDIQLDALLKLRGELNSALESRGVKLSVNDLLVKALALSLLEVPACNVQFAGDTLISFTRADISVAVSIPGGLITPVVVDAGTKGIAAIATEIKDLAGRARAGKLQPSEYQGGTASLSNMGMYGIKQFEAVINPPQGMIMAIGAGEKRPYIVDGKLDVATVMSATGSFDHRAIDGADGAQLMAAFKRLVEKPLGMLA
ncbi:pyruvate dehydrogenase complex dihydrolipoamide acetyltransferase [Sphingomonas solaris]|uniref:Acetyltransferase component of pyruvate dehydrogenase complex n=1 Tax=Alterirhizorhabdus solaris TaxID=2529389 RepID=A0A558R032_9SPHN|nr:pyruvate dehydrogenase complex dihydrolipoamide acetyltransferase [Sphingomonas solaris]TVV72736.1 pyruvate dehydrogenase complex dihydrolipoamide acetyltransferase [Sphingomonas solaris]